MAVRFIYKHSLSICSGPSFASMSGCRRPVATTAGQRTFRGLFYHRRRRCTGQPGRQQPEMSQVLVEKYIWALLGEVCEKLEVFYKSLNILFYTPAQ
jgi:hypothetical protein